MLYLSRKDLLGLVRPDALVAALEQGLRDLAANRTCVPMRQHVEWAGSTLLTMPAMGHEGFGAKIAFVTPSNAQHGLPVINGLMILSDRMGLPLAVLDAAMLTAQRTGAIGALALKYTAPDDTDCVGIIGTGVQARWQAIFAGAVLRVHTVFFLARSDEKARSFMEAVQHELPAVRLVRCDSVQDLLSSTRVIIAATSASEPVLPSERGLLENKHFVSIGSFKPSMREFPELLYEMAPCVVVDSEAAQHEAGDLVAPLASGALHAQHIVHIAELVTGMCAIDRELTTVFKSVGMALYDLYAARAFLVEAQRLGRGTALDVER